MTPYANDNGLIHTQKEKKKKGTYGGGSQNWNCARVDFYSQL